MKMRTVYPPKPYLTFNEWAKFIAEQVEPPKVKKKSKKKTDNSLAD